MSNVYEVVPLSELLDNYDEANITKVLDNFKTVDVDKDVEDFLRHKAISFQKADASRTYLVFLKINRKTELVGYFSIISKPLVISGPKWNKLSGTTRKSLVGRYNYKKINENDHRDITGILLGQLGKDVRFKNDVKGADLLALAEQTAKNAWRAVGGRLLWLEADNNEKLTQFYESNEYTRVVNNESEVLLNQNGQNFFIKLLSNLEI